MNLDIAIFLISAFVAVFGGVMMISIRNPIASVLYLILSLVAQAVLFVQLGALFLGAILVLVYAGAIMVLFLFVIMLLNLRGKEELGHQAATVGSFSRYLIGILISMELIFMVKSVFLPGAVAGLTAPLPKDFGSVHTVATLLFTNYMFPFQLTGVLLTIAVVGAVVIAKQESGDGMPDSAATNSDSDETSIREVED